MSRPRRTYRRLLDPDGVSSRHSPRGEAAAAAAPRRRGGVRRRAQPSRRRSVREAGRPRSRRAVIEEAARRRNQRRACRRRDPRPRRLRRARGHAARQPALGRGRRLALQRRRHERPAPARARRARRRRRRAGRDHRRARPGRVRAPARRRWLSRRPAVTRASSRSARSYAARRRTSSTSLRVRLAASSSPGSRQGVPVAFGVLTVDTVEQAEARIDEAAEAVRIGARDGRPVRAELRASAARRGQPATLRRAMSKVCAVCGKKPGLRESPLATRWSPRSAGSTRTCNGSAILLKGSPDARLRLHPLPEERQGPRRPSEHRATGPGRFPV